MDNLKVCDNNQCSARGQPITPARDLNMCLACGDILQPYSQGLPSAQQHQGSYGAAYPEAAYLQHGHGTSAPYMSQTPQNNAFAQPQHQTQVYIGNIPSYGYQFQFGQEAVGPGNAGYSHNSTDQASTNPFMQSSQQVLYSVATPTATPFFPSTNDHYAGTHHQSNKRGFEETKDGGSRSMFFPSSDAQSTREVHRGQIGTGPSAFQASGGINQGSFANRVMTNMGHNQSQGLGNHGQGITEPIQPIRVDPRGSGAGYGVQQPPGNTSSHGQDGQPAKRVRQDHSQPSAQAQGGGQASRGCGDGRGRGRGRDRGQDQGRGRGRRRGQGRNRGGADLSTQSRYYQAFVPASSDNDGKAATPATKQEAQSVAPKGSHHLWASADASRYCHDCHKVVWHQGQNSCSGPRDTVKSKYNLDANAKNAIKADLAQVPRDFDDFVDHLISCACNAMELRRYVVLRDTAIKAAFDWMPAPVDSPTAWKVQLANMFSVANNITFDLLTAFERAVQTTWYPKIYHILREDFVALMKPSSSDEYRKKYPNFAEQVKLALHLRTLRETPAVSIDVEVLAAYHDFMQKPFADYQNSMDRLQASFVVSSASLLDPAFAALEQTSFSQRSWYDLQPSVDATSQWLPRLSMPFDAAVFRPNVLPQIRQRGGRRLAADLWKTSSSKQSTEKEESHQTLEERPQPLAAQKACTNDGTSAKSQATGTPLADGEKLSVEPPVSPGILKKYASHDPLMIQASAI